MKLLSQTRQEFYGFPPLSPAVWWVFTKTIHVNLLRKQKLSSVHVLVLVDILLGQMDVEVETFDTCLNTSSLSF